MTELAQIPGEEDTDTISQRQDVLRFEGELLGDARVRIRRSRHARMKHIAQAIGDDLFRDTVTIACREILPRLRGHPVALDIPEGPVIEHDIKGVVEML